MAYCLLAQALLPRISLTEGNTINGQQNCFLFLLTISKLIITYPQDRFSELLRGASTVLAIGDNTVHTPAGTKVRSEYAVKTCRKRKEIADLDGNRVCGEADGRAEAGDPVGKA